MPRLSSNIQKFQFFYSMLDYICIVLFFMKNRGNSEGIQSKEK